MIAYIELRYQLGIFRLILYISVETNYEFLSLQEGRKIERHDTC